MIRPLTILDNIFGSRVTKDNVISNNQKDVSVLAELFSATLSGQRYAVNEYIWNTIKVFVENKTKISVWYDALHQNCKNKDLLNLIFYDVVKNNSFDDTEIRCENQNMPKRDILKVFKNVTSLNLDCRYCPISLESLLSLIIETQIETVTVHGYGWMPHVISVSSFDDILSKYEEANLIMDFRGNDYVIISYGSVE